VATVAVVTGRTVVGISRTELLEMDLVFPIDRREMSRCRAGGAP
jgi:hypothetical protein